MSWMILFCAGLFEIAWAVGLKFTEGFTRFWPSVGTLAALVISVGLLGLAARALPIGTAYAVWTGIGAVGTGSVERSFSANRSRLSASFVLGSSSSASLG